MMVINGRKSQYDRILYYLEMHPEGITPYEAFLELGVTKLATRISEMIRKGYAFEKIPESRVNVFGETKRFMRYRKAA